MIRKLFKFAAFMLCLAFVSGSAFASFPNLALTRNLGTSQQPVVNWQGLQNVGLNGSGVVIGIVSRGTTHLDTAISDGLLPSNTVATAGVDTYGDHATMTAIIVHEIAPKAKIVIANDLNYSTLVNTYHAQVVIDNYDADDGYSFPSSRLSAINSNPGVLFFLSDSDTSGAAFWQGSWTPAPNTITVSGTATTVEDFGKASGGASDPVETIQTVNSGTDTSNAYAITLDWYDTNTSEGADFYPVIYNGNGQLISSITASTPTPINIYIAGGSGSASYTGNIKIQMYFGDGSYGAPFSGVKYTTGGGAQPLLPSVGPNTFVVTGAQSQSMIWADSGTGPELWLNPNTDAYTNVQFPDIAADVCSQFPSTLPWPPGYLYFCGDSNAAPVAGGVAALLLQAGLSASQVENSVRLTANNPVKGEGIWGGAWGYGYVQPVAALKQYVSLPTPAINGGYQASGTTGQSLSFSGSCTAPSGDTVSGYTWNFGDGSSGTGSQVSHSWASAGSYTVSLNCSDSAGFSSDTPAEITVNITRASSGGGSGGGSSTSSGGGGAFGLLALAVLGLFAGAVRATAGKSGG